MFVLIKKLKKNFLFSALIGISASFMSITAMCKDMEEVDESKINLKNLSKLKNFTLNTPPTSSYKDIGKVGEPEKKFFTNLNCDLDLNTLQRLYGHYFTLNTLAEQLVYFGVPIETVNKIKCKFWKYKFLCDTTAVTIAWHDGSGKFRRWFIVPPSSSDVNYYKPGILDSGTLLNILPVSSISDPQKQNIKDIDGLIFSEATLFAELFSNCGIRSRDLRSLKEQCWEKGILKNVCHVLG